MTAPQGQVEAPPLGGEWVLLANALADPIEEMIAVEARDPGQMREMEQRLAELAGLRSVLWQPVDPAGESAETLWRRARYLVQTARDQALAEATSIPLLIVVIHAWSEGPAERERLAEFWRGMNQLRERWHDLPAQVLFLLSPIAYEHLTLNADHLKRWIGLKVHLGGATLDLAELLRPGTVLGRAIRQEQEAERALASARAIRHQSLDLLARQAREAEGRGEGLGARVRRYYLPLALGYLALADVDQARGWRGLIGDTAALDPEDLPGLLRLDERLLVLGRQVPGTVGKSVDFDIFLSYNSRDKTAVHALAGALRTRGLRVWLDDEQVSPGVPLLPQLEAGLRASRSVAVLIGPGGLAHWQHEEIQAAFRLAAEDNRPIIPVLLPGAPGLFSPLFGPLANRNELDLRSGIDSAALDKFFRAIARLRPDNSDPPS
jgi:hypothetical protein